MTRAKSRDGALDAASSRLAYLIRDITGTDWQITNEQLEQSETAKRLNYLHYVASQATSPLTRERAKVHQEATALRQLLLVPIIGSTFLIPDGFEESYWGTVINNALARLYSVNEIITVTEATQLLGNGKKLLPRRSLQKWRDTAIFDVILVLGRPYYIREQVVAKAAERKDTWQGRPPGRVKQDETKRPRLKRRGI